MNRFKIALALIASFLLLVVILQNTDTVETRILSTTISMPRSALLFVAVLLGFVLGFATALWRRVLHRHEGAAATPGASLLKAKSPSGAAR